MQILNLTPADAKLHSWLQTNPGVCKLFCWQANFRLYENLAGQSKIVIHVVFARNKALKQYLVAVFIQSGGEVLFLQMNTFKAIFIPNVFTFTCVDQIYCENWFIRDASDRFATQGH